MRSTFSNHTIGGHTIRGPLAVLLTVSVALMTLVGQGPARAQALTDNTGTAYRYLVGKGLSANQAAGVVGNLMQESGITVNPRSVQPHGPGRGIAQWSVNERWAVGTKWANQQGRDIWALDTQLDFLWHELQTTEKSALTAIRASGTLTQAVRAFNDKFERCSKCEISTRVRYAQQTLNRFGGATPSTPSQTTSLPTLKRGASGHQVTTLQYALSAAGHKLDHDGIFGAGTASAVTAFQKAHGLSPDGVVGLRTWTALLGTIKQGARGDLVRAVQLELRRTGSSIAADGIFGAGTAGAVKTVQQRAGIGVDGVVGVKTWAVLLG